MTISTALSIRNRRTSRSALRRLIMEPLEQRMLMTASQGSAFVTETPIAADRVGDSVAVALRDKFVGPVSDDRGAADTSGLQRYAILGEDLSAAEAALADMGRIKIKNFQHFSGMAVHLSQSEAEALRASLGPEVRVLMDEPIQGIAAVENAKQDKSGGIIGAKPGGGGPPSGGGQQVPLGISQVNAPAAWSVSRGTGVAVCVVDTGLDQDHPDLAANIARGYNYISNSGNYDDDNGHGTHVGGTIAALDNTIGVVGVAPQASLLAAKAFDRRGSGTRTDIAEAIYGCLDLKDQVNPAMPLIVNMSFGIGGTAEEREIVHAPIRDLHAMGVIFTGAAGNFGNWGLSTPARWDEVLCISGANRDLSAIWESSGAGRNPDYPDRNPDFIAPAVDVLSLYRGGGTKILSGTSMSAAHASGVFALAFSSGSLGPVGRDLGLPVAHQGQGLIDALLTVQNQALEDARPASVAAPQSRDQSTENQSSLSDSAASGGAFSGVEGAPLASVPFEPTPAKPAASDSFPAIDLLMADLGGPSLNQGSKWLTLSLDAALDGLVAAT